MKMKKLLISISSGLLAAILTISYQHFIAQRPTEDYENSSSAYEALKAENYLLKSENDSLESENNLLKNENDSLKMQITKLTESIDEAKSQSDNFPTINYSNLSLFIEGEDIPINKNNAMITIDGRDYISKEITEKLIPDGQTITLKDNVLYIGKIISEQSCLLDQVTVEKIDMSIVDRVNDSYGNLHTRTLHAKNYHSYIIFNLNRQFSLLKFKLAVQEKGFSDAIVTVKADNAVVYTSPELTITTEPFDVIDIPINNCSLLTINIDSGPQNGFGKGFDCIISEPIVYN